MVIYRGFGKIRNSIRSARHVYMSVVDLGFFAAGTLGAIYAVNNNLGGSAAACSFLALMSAVDGANRIGGGMLYKYDDGHK